MFLFSGFVEMRKSATMALTHWPPDATHWLPDDTLWLPVAVWLSTSTLCPDPDHIHAQIVVLGTFAFVRVIAWHYSSRPLEGLVSRCQGRQGVGSLQRVI